VEVVFTLIMPKIFVEILEFFITTQKIANSGLRKAMSLAINKEGVQ